jgi:hypothetical protein
MWCSVVWYEFTDVSKDCLRLEGPRVSHSRSEQALLACLVYSLTMKVDKVLFLRNVGQLLPDFMSSHTSTCPHAVVRNAWSYISTSPYIFIAWRLMKEGDNVTLLYLIYIYYCRRRRTDCETAGINKSSLLNLWTSWIGFLSETSF